MGCPFFAEAPWAMGEACLATAIRLSLSAAKVLPFVLLSSFCVPRRTNRPAKGRRRAKTAR